MIQTSYKPGEWDFPTLYANGEWEPDTRAVLQSILQPGDIFLDVGAWCGPVSLWAVEFGAQVIAYEPDPIARKCLLENTQGLPVEVRQEAWSNSMGQGILVSDRYFGDSSSRLGILGEVDAFPDFESLVVLKTTPKKVFQDLGQQHRLPNMVKVDIEGGEIDVLPQLGPLCRFHSVPLLVSCHQPWWSRPVDEGEIGLWFEGMTLSAPFEGWNNVLAVPE